MDYFKEIHSESLDTLAKDLYSHVTENMSPDDIQVWLNQMLEVTSAHMNACAEAPGSMDEVDESLLMHENVFLYLLGLAQANNYFQRGGLH